MGGRTVNEMKLHEVFTHPDAMTLEIVMTIDDPKTYTQPWVGNKQVFRLDLPKDLTILDQDSCVPSEEAAVQSRRPQPGRRRPGTRTPNEISLHLQM